MSSIRELTRPEHTSAESTSLAKALIAGEVTREVYEIYVTQKLFISQSLDYYLPEGHALRRADLLMKDLMELGTKRFIYLSETMSYVNHIRSLEGNVDAHIYVNYLGDLYGGQVIRERNSSLPVNHLTYDNKDECIMYVRNLIQGRDEELAPEASTAFTFIEGIYNAIWTS